MSEADIAEHHISSTISRQPPVWLNGSQQVLDHRLNPQSGESLLAIDQSDEFPGT